MGLLTGYNPVRFLAESVAVTLVGSALYSVAQCAFGIDSISGAIEKASSECTQHSGSSEDLGRCLTEVFRKDERPIITNVGDAREITFTMGKNTVTIPIVTEINCGADPRRGDRCSKDKIIGAVVVTAG